MAKKDEFKDFVRKNPKLINYVKEKLVRMIMDI